MLPKLPRLTPEEAENILLKNGFNLVRTKGIHRIYIRKEKRFIIPFHRGKTLHPKIVKALIGIIEDKINE